MPEAAFSDIESDDEVERLDNVEDGKLDEKPVDDEISVDVGAPILVDGGEKDTELEYCNRDPATGKV